MGVIAEIFLQKRRKILRDRCIKVSIVNIPAIVWLCQRRHYQRTVFATNCTIKKFRSSSVCRGICISKTTKIPKYLYTPAASRRRSNR